MVKVSLFLFKIIPENQRNYAMVSNRRNENDNLVPGINVGGTEPGQFL